MTCTASPNIKSRWFAACGFTIAALAGCNTPDKANILLRREAQKRDEEIARLTTQHVGDEATIRALQDKSGVQPAISQDLIEKLFTVHSIQLGRLTGPDDWDASAPGDDGIKVYITPIDEQGDKLKAAGRFNVQAFDLASPDQPLVGKWSFDTKQSRDAWYGGAFGSHYVLKCPWQKPPPHGELTVKVTFIDELTGREFSVQKVVKVMPQPPTTQPGSNTAPKPS